MLRNNMRGKFMNKFDDTQLYKLLIASNLQDIDDFLNKYGIDSVDRDGRTFLMSAVSENKIEIVSHLIKNGTDVTKQDKQGLTALHLACFEDNQEIAQLLIDNGSKIDQIDNEGNTALWRAVMAHDENARTVKLLISKGADVNIQNKHGVSPSDLM